MYTAGKSDGFPRTFDHYGQTVNLPGFPYAGSNPALSTIPFGEGSMRQRRLMHAPRWAFGLLVLAGCSGAGAPPNSADAPLRIVVSFQPPQGCRIVAAGRTFVLPGEGRALEAVLARARPRSRRAAIGGDESAPFRCFGNAAYHAQRAGFTDTSVPEQERAVPVPR